MNVSPQMSLSTPGSEALALLQFLWNSSDRSVGWSIADLPMTARSEVLLTLCANLGYIELGERRFDGGRGEEYWHSHQLGGERPCGSFIRLALANEAPIRDGSVTSPSLVRLTGYGEAAVCRALAAADSLRNGSMNHNSGLS